MLNRQPNSSERVSTDPANASDPGSTSTNQIMRQIWQDLTNLYDRHPRWGAALAGTALLLGLTGVHASLGFTSALRALYVLPIWLATRMGGRISGFALAVFCTVAGIVTDWQIAPYPNEGVVANVVIRFLGFVLLMLLIAQVEQALTKHQRMALTDPLTGLLNRHALREFAQHAFYRAMLRNQPMTVVVIDCDGFKQLNDTYGHKAGDHVLTLLARALESQTRQTDLVARLGGDEFAVVCQNTDIEEAQQIIQRVDESFTRAVMDAGFAASLSIGFGTTNGGHNDLDAVLEEADSAMYEHKHLKKAGAFLN
jgi:diguanylate cyclase (GGDEF)-like protein